ncbi:hypothetical protein BGX31_002409 [Mortierella sp. GBA43]|nr:hypothetical protein BGX31_002409 [Mortierella sp. GBA43]
MTPESYINAITAFAQCHEDWPPMATSSLSTRDDIVRLLQKLERRKVERIQQSGPRTAFQHRPMANFKSRNGDQYPRYNPRTVQDLTKASPVRYETLQHLTIPEPKPHVVKPKEAQDQAPKPKPVPRKQYNKKGNDQRNKSEVKVDKDLFKKVFKTVALTMGALTSCIVRATSLKRNQAELITSRLNGAVHVASRSRIMVLKAIENCIYLKVTGSTAVDPHPIPDEFDPLDLILHRTHGAIVRNLISLVMSGGMDMATDLHSDIKTYFRKLPETIVTKVTDDEQKE